MALDDSIVKKNLDSFERQLTLEEMLFWGATELTTPDGIVRIEVDPYLDNVSALAKLEDLAFAILDYLRNYYKLEVSEAIFKPIKANNQYYLLGLVKPSNKRSSTAKTIEEKEYKVHLIPLYLGEGLPIKEIIFNRHYSNRNIYVIKFVLGEGVGSMDKTNLTLLN